MRKTKPKEPRDIDVDIALAQRRVDRDERPSAKADIEEGRRIRDEVTATFNEVAKVYFRKRAAKERARKKLANLVADLDGIEAQIRDTLVTAKIETIRSRGFMFTPSFRDIAEIYDVDALFEHVRRKNAFELLHKRVSIEAFYERIKAGQTVPGVREGRVPTLSVAKGKPLKGER